MGKPRLVLAENPCGLKAWSCFAVFDQGGPNGETLLPIAVVYSEDMPTVEELEEAIPGSVPDGRWTYEVEAVPTLAPRKYVKIS